MPTLLSSLDTASPRPRVTLCIQRASPPSGMISVRSDDLSAASCPCAYPDAPALALEAVTAPSVCCPQRGGGGGARSRDCPPPPPLYFPGTSPEFEQTKRPRGGA